MKNSIIPSIICSAFIIGGVGESLFSQENISGDTADGYELSLQSLLNMEVTTASKSSEKQSDAPGIISVVTKDELERFGGTTLKDILERMPSLISSGANYTARTTIASRGDQIKQNSAHILILIDGRPVREVQEAGVNSEMFEAFPVNIIEKIEVIRGPGSVLYGSDAFSAVINIITEKAEKNSVSATGLVEMNGGLGTLGDIKLKIGDLSIVAAERILNKSEWDAPFVYSNQFMPFMPGSDTTVTLPIPNKANGAFVKMNYKGFSLTSTYEKWITAAINMNLRENTETKKYFSNFGYDYKISDKWNIDANITYARSKLYGYMCLRDCYNLVAELTNSIIIDDKTKAVVGGLFNLNDGEELSVPSKKSISKGSINSYAAYAQLDCRFIESLKLIGGIQANKVGKLKLNFVPRGGVIWYPFSQFSVKGLYSEAYRAPSINENYINYIIFGDPNLKPERVATWDFGLSYQGEQVQVELNYFRSKMTDIIQYYFTPQFTLQYYNAANVTFQGIELETKYYANKNFYVNASLLYQGNKNDTMDNLTPIANFSAKGGISYVWEKGIIISLFDIYQGDLDSMYTRHKNPNQGAYNLLHLHADFNINKLVNWTLKPEFSFFFNIDNLLDKPHYGFDMGGYSNDAIPSIPGRAVYLGLNTKF